MDEAVNGLLAELDALGIPVKEERGEVSVRPTPPSELLARLRRHKDALAQAVWARDGRARQASDSALAAVPLATRKAATGRSKISPRRSSTRFVQSSRP